MRLIAAVVAIAIPIAFAAAAQAGDVYKWKDKDGRVHYGDKPKHEAQATNIEGGEPADPEVEKAAAARAAECQRMKGQLEGYRKATTIQETDNLGQTRDYTPEERQKFIEIYEKKAADACAPPPANVAGAGTPEAAAETQQP